MRTLVGHQIAEVVGAGDAVVAARRIHRNTAQHQAAHFYAVTGDVVVAGRVVGRVIALVVDLIAEIDGAAQAVIAAKPNAGRASRARRAVLGIAYFRAIAEGIVRAHRVIGRVGAGFRSFIAGVGGAARAVVATGSRAALAHARVAGFDAVAEQAVIAIGVCIAGAGASAAAAAA